MEIPWSLETWLVTLRVCGYLASNISRERETSKQFEALQALNREGILKILADADFQEGLANLLEEGVREFEQPAAAVGAHGLASKFAAAPAFSLCASMGLASTTRGFSGLLAFSGITVAGLLQFFGVAPFKGFQTITDKAMVGATDLVYVRKEAAGLAAGTWLHVKSMEPDSVTLLSLDQERRLTRLSARDLRKCSLLKATVRKDMFKEGSLFTLIEELATPTGIKLSAGRSGKVMANAMISIDECEEEIVASPTFLSKVTDYEAKELVEVVLQVASAERHLRLLCLCFMTTKPETDHCLRWLLHELIVKLSSGKGFAAAMRAYTGKPEAFTRALPAKAVHQEVTIHGKRIQQRVLALEDCRGLPPLELKALFDLKTHQDAAELFSLQRMEEKSGAGNWRKDEEILVQSTLFGGCYFARLESVNDKKGEVLARSITQGFEDRSFVFQVSTGKGHLKGKEGWKAAAYALTCAE